MGISMAIKVREWDKSGRQTHHGTAVRQQREETDTG